MSSDEDRLDPTRSRTSGWRRHWRQFSLWFNPTLIQQALWPAVALFAGFAIEDDTDVSWIKWMGQVLCLVLAIALALLTIRRHKILQSSAEASGQFAANIRLLIIGLPIMVFGVRILAQDPAAVIRVGIAGLLSAVALQLICAWIGPAVFPWTGGAIILFGLSMSIHQIGLALTRTAGDSLVLEAIGGLSVGIVIGAGSLALARWPGGRWTPIAAQWLVMTLILRFAV